LTNYKAIIFDLDNTLLNYSASVDICMRKAVHDHGLASQESFSWNSFWPVFDQHNTYYWNDRITSGNSIHRILELSFRDSLDQLGLDASGAQELSELYWNGFCRTCDFEEHAQNLLERLHGTHRLAIISNGVGEAQRRRLAAGQVEHYFESLVFSDEVKCWKPDSRIFEEALKQLRISSEEALFVGDSIQDDYTGARNAGIDFCYYNRDGVVLDSSVRPKYAVRSLKELSEFF
jgi:2-haloacid dehalogenase